MDFFFDKLQTSNVKYKWELILPDWRWLQEAQAISTYPVGLGYLHRAGRHRPGGPLFCPRFDGIVDVWKGL